MNTYEYDWLTEYILDHGNFDRRLAMAKIEELKRRKAELDEEIEERKK